MPEEVTLDPVNAGESGQSLGGITQENEPRVDVSEKTPISDEDRKRYNIPEKFKDWNSVVAWGSEAEKAKSKAESERAEFEKKMFEYEEALAESGKDPDKKGEISGEDRARLNAEFRDRLLGDRSLDAMQELFDKFAAKLESLQEKRELERKWAKEEKEISSDAKYKENWPKIKSELYKIAKERPHLQSIEEALAIYERNLARETDLNKTEGDRKKTEKQSAFSESGGGGHPPVGDLAKKIADAKTIEELEALSSKIGK